MEQETENGGKHQQFQAYQKEKKEKEQEHRRENVRLLTLVTQFGINMLVPIFLCFFLGMFLDKKLGTNYLAVLLFFVGALAGFRNIYLFARKTGGKKSDQEDKH